MGFLRVVEVFPPLFPASQAKDGPIDVDEKVEVFVEGVRRVRGLADIFLVASVKNPALLKLSTIEAACILQERLGVEAGAVVVARDMNRLEFLSSVLTGISRGVGSLMIAWGDSYPASAGAANIRDFSSLGEAIGEASLIRKRSRASTRFFAPLSLGMLARRGGIALARDRLRSGAEMLLAQPPTTDAQDEFERHAALLRGSRLAGRVLLNVFPFRDRKDVRECERYFGWRLPASLYRTAAKGESSLIESERMVVQRLRDEGFPGVYLATRGEPSTAERLLS
jgi:hypothetical protein